MPQISIAAFCEDSALAATVEAAATDRRMSRARATWHMGGLSAAIELYRSSPTPSLILVETIDDDDEVLFARLEELAEHCLTTTKVIVIGHRNDVGLYRDLLERGVNDYLVAPLGPIPLIAAISRLYRDTGPQTIGRICAFLGARGGAGSSTVAHNVAFSLASVSEAEVLLVDLDLPFGTVGLDFNVEAPQGILDVIGGVDRLDDVLLERMSTAHGERLNLLTPPLALDGAYDLAEAEVDRLMEVARAGARITILDVPHMWTAWTKRILAGADEIVVTAEPDLASMRNVKAILEFLAEARPNDTAPHLVLNRMKVPKRPEIKPQAFASAVGLTPALSIAFDPKTFGLAANNGQMIAEVAAKSAPAKDFSRLAQTLAAGAKKTPSLQKKGLGRLTARLLGRK
ncbi:AAA family ATPase [Consotaella salsifontis]|uniref:Pilus assembly protein CpaE n=1 Tax=Consotaella salsifontis TaxID=1365950 RepID=A0A1T4PVN3_9HYPH|nr:AAA family ATPase [Consotaella salsifontis]SJZ95416.1 pilus assembly protein CpaE [Consotaella salsifontis]